MRSLLIILLFPIFIIAKDVCSPCKCYLDENYIFKADCSRNTIKTSLLVIPPGIPTNIQVLWFSGQSFQILNNSTFTAFNNLNLIWYNSNDIEIIEGRTFKNMTTLEDLKLSNNKIKFLPYGIFSDLEKVTKIGLSYNLLTNLPMHLFSNLTKLQNIYLEYNKINTISKDCFYKLPSLRFVRLMGNNLKTLHPNIIDNRNQLKELFALNENPWHCDANLCPLADSVSKPTLEAMKCNTPLDAQDKPWNELLKQIPAPRSRDDYDVEIGQTAHLECHYCLASKIIWKLNNTRIWRNSTSQIENSISTLILPKVSEKDQGIYSCHVHACDECSFGTTTLTVHRRLQNNSVLYNIKTENKVERISEYTQAKEDTNSSSINYVIAGGIASIILIAIGILLVCRFKYNKFTNKQEEETNECSIRFGPDPAPFTPPEPANNKTNHQKTSNNSKNQETTNSRRQQQTTSNHKNEQTSNSAHRQAKYNHEDEQTSNSSRQQTTSNNKNKQTSNSTRNKQETSKDNNLNNDELLNLLSVESAE